MKISCMRSNQNFVSIQHAEFGTNLFSPDVKVPIFSHFSSYLLYVLCFADRIHDRYITFDLADNILLSRSSSQGISRRLGLAFYT